MHSHSYENEFNLHVNEITFSYEKIGTKTRFEEEAKGNSEMAYCYATQQNSSLYVFLFFGLDRTPNNVKHNSCLLLNYGLTNRNVFGYVRNSCIVYECNTNDCAWSWTFQQKSWHLCLIL